MSDPSPLSPADPGPAAAPSVPAPAAAKPAAAKPPAPPPPPPDPAVEALRAWLGETLGGLGTFELAGKLPAIRVAPGDLLEAARRLRDAGLDYLCAMTAVDLPTRNLFEMIYVAGSYGEAREVALVAEIDRADPRVSSLVPVWPAAEWHERETYDFFGIRFENHPDLRRILLDDTWEGFPLRKDYVDVGHDVVKRPY